MRNYFIILTDVVLIFLVQAIKSQHVCTLRIDVPEKVVSHDHLKLGGTNFQGKQIEVNSYYLKANGKPVVPVSGEFHFSRYPDKYWEEAIRKMKAGGLDCIATYVFWNMHEEEEGQFKWEGMNNLRKFIELCDKYEFDVIVRIGPFCHGEVRNGGFPDWLLGKPLTIRSNDPNYLLYVERLYQQIGKQLEGLLFKDGGPVIGIQLENEFQHSAAPWGLTYPGQPHDYTASEQDKEVTQEGVGTAAGENPYSNMGNEHMRILKALAIKAGMVVPLYTATGWGYAAIIENETLPVAAAYPYPTWAPGQPSEFYLYTDLQKDPDYAPVRYKSEDYPYMAAEIGGGIMNTYDRRPLIPSNSLDPMINRFIGSGANGIGYYMYHGGSTPRGNRNFLSDMAVGCPIISYDFQAPIGEYGQLKPSFHRLKLLHFFLQAFGDLLAPMQTILPRGYEQITPGDSTTVRYAVRSKDGRGFIFVNNYQDHLPVREIQDVRFRLQTDSGDLLIPENGSFTLGRGEHAIFPYHMDLGGINLNYATAQLLTKLIHDQDIYYVFFVAGGIDPEYSIKKIDGIDVTGINGCMISENSDRFMISCGNTGSSEFRIKKINGKTINILTIDHELALKTYIGEIEGSSHIMFSEALVLQRKGLFDLLSLDKPSFELSVYPGLLIIPELSYGKITRLENTGSSMTVFRIALPAQNFDPETRTIQDNKILISLPDGKPAGINDLFLVIDYIGDTGMGFLDGDLVADNFYNGREWSIGLKRFLDLPGQHDMVFYFRPMYADAPYLDDLKNAGLEISTDSGENVKINEIKLLPEYITTISF